MYVRARVTISGHFRERVILGYIRFVAVTFCQMGRQAIYLDSSSGSNLLIDVANRAFTPAKLCLAFYNLSFFTVRDKYSLAAFNDDFMRNYNKFSTRNSGYFFKSLRKKIIMPSFWIFNSKIAASKMLIHFQKCKAKAMSKMAIL